MPLGIWNRTHTYTNFPRKSDPFIYQPTQFWSKFWQSYCPPPFFFIYCFLFFKFSKISANFGSNVRKIEKSTHSYTKFCIDMGSLIYWYTKSQYLQDLHWLPVDKRILYKMFLYVYKCLNGFGPNYLASSFSLYKQSRYNLRSAADTSRLTVPKFKSKGLKSAFNRSFSLTTPTLWNSLPSELRSAASLVSFKKGLKIYLFPQWSGCFVSVCCFCFCLPFFCFDFHLGAVVYMKWRLTNALYVCMYVCISAVVGMFFPYRHVGIIWSRRRHACRHNSSFKIEWNTRRKTVKTKVSRIIHAYIISLPSYIFIKALNLL